MNRATTKKIGGVILAGGQGSRMGQPKASVMLGGQSLLAHVIARFAPQVASLVINSNTAIEGVDYPVIEDRIPGYRGPLMGLYTALSCPQLAACDLIAVAPVDAPLLPTDLVATLLAAMLQQNAEVACVIEDGIHQAVFSLWQRDTFLAVQESVTHGDGGFKPLLARLTLGEVSWPQGSLSPFTNINTPEQLAALERQLANGV